jgi:PAS domain S-box-containing protein
MPFKNLLPYLFALGAVTLAGGIRGSLLSGLMADRSPFGLFTLAIICSAWLGGIGPGLLATGLGALAGVLFFISPYSISPQHVVLIVTFTLNGILISIVCESLHRSRRRAEKARDELEKSQLHLRESESRFRQLADSAPVLIWMTDAAGNCSWLNRPWLEFTGQPLEEQTGRGWEAYIHPDDLERSEKIFRRHFETRTTFEIDYRLRRHDGIYRWILARGMPLFSGDGSFLGYMGGCIDIHERKEAEKDSEALLKMEQRARLDAERTALLKDEFLATVSHEMRTPLTAMLGWVQLLRSGTISADTVPQALETIERNARAQAKLIDDLLDMSRILSGRLRLDVQQVQPAEIVEAAISAAEPAATAKNVRLISDLAPRTGPVVGDPTRLQQIIWNLLNNAIKFTPSKGTVTVRMSRLDFSLQISVSDTGEGITPEFLPHVFDRFRQQDASTMRRHQGLGLGLAIVKQLVELHGGSVEAQSEGIGKGSTFVVSLPVSASFPPEPVRVDPVTPVKHEESREEIPLPSLLGTKVLVVDDDADARELLRSILAQSGASVRTAGSVDEALRQFEARRPHVLVSDIGMPGRDGYELIREIRTRDEENGGLVPALALTAFARSDDRRRAIGAGFHMHLAKPVEPAELVTVVSSLTRR